MITSAKGINSCCQGNSLAGQTKDRPQGPNWKKECLSCALPWQFTLKSCWYLPITKKPLLVSCRKWICPFSCNGRDYFTALFVDIESERAIATHPTVALFLVRSSVLFFLDEHKFAIFRHFCFYLAPGLLWEKMLFQNWNFHYTSSFSHFLDSWKLFWLIYSLHIDQWKKKPKKQIKKKNPVKSGKGTRMKKTPISEINETYPSIL